MPKVHPNAIVVAPPPQTPKPTSEKKHKQEVLTIWKKSLLFHCKGFTVFDTKGNLVYRVDNYFSSNKSEILLMDASGSPLLTICRKKLTLADSWAVYDGETKVNPLYTVRKNVNFLNSKLLAQVNSRYNSNNRTTVYQIEGSYAQRCCAVYDAKRRVVAEIKQKESVAGASFGLDVFRLVVQPEMDPTVAMAFVILLEQMFGSRWSGSSA